MERLFKTIKLILSIVMVLFSVAIILPVFICDRFSVKGSSMSPTYSSGEHIWVNKLCMGPRIYTNYDFDSPELKAFRLPGFKNLEVGDVAVFNVPYGRDKEKIEFRINYVYAKRCLGCPGDTVGISDCMFYNTKTDTPIGYLPNQHLLKQTPDSLIPDYALAAYPYSYDFNWTIKELGPLVVPYKGMKVSLDYKTALLYSHAIEYETGFKPQWNAGMCYIGETSYRDYQFRKDYYYFIGDNVLDSKDSRYLGFVPEDYIIGKVVD